MFCNEIGSKTTLYDGICVPVFYDKLKSTSINKITVICLFLKEHCNIAKCLLIDNF